MYFKREKHDMNYLFSISHQYYPTVFSVYCIETYLNP